jgi:hypothetical protein
MSLAIRLDNAIELQQAKTQMPALANFSGDNWLSKTEVCGISFCSAESRAFGFGEWQ